MKRLFSLIALLGFAFSLSGDVTKYHSLIARKKAAGGSSDSPGITNMVGNWSMDETSGTRADGHGNNDLTDNNTVGSTTGVISNAASFVSANSEYLSSTTVPVSGTGARSLEAWFKTSTSGTMHIIGFGGSNDSTNGAAFRLSIENGSLFCRVYGGYAGFGGSWNDGSWHQVVLKVMDSGYVGDLEVYVDGSSQTRVSGSNLTLTAINTGTDSFFVGQNIDSGATQYFNGDVDIVRVFDDELTTDEITWLYNNGSGRSYSDVAGSSYFLEQNFDTSGTPTNFNVSQGSVSFNATPPTTSPQGGGTLYTADRNNNATISLATKYAYFQLYVDSFGEGSTNIFTIKTSDSAHRVRAKLYSDGVIRLDSPSGHVDLTEEYTTETWYHIWMYYNPSTGAASLEFNTTGTPSGSGDGYASMTLGTTSASLTQVEINGRRSSNMYMDRVLLSNSTIGAQ